MDRKTNATPASAGRVRWQLLVLLWVWAGCVGLVLDLFLNVDEFDGVRPRAPLYRAMRVVAHEMIGERSYDADFAAGPAPRSRKDHTSKGMTRAPDPPTGPLFASSRHPNGIPDLQTPQGARLYDGLRRAATAAPNRAKQQGALRSLATMFGASARPALLEVASDITQATETRDLARKLADRVPEQAPFAPFPAHRIAPTPGGIR
jgi:hypothetical protein